MPITEALRLVVDADTRGAVRGVENLGRTAERELSRSEKSLDKWGNRLTNVGAGMIGLGAVALVGLGKAAEASEEANLATVKLENTLQNMPKLAGESSQQFIDLAESIQDVTAADADAIVEGQALLGTFQLTADEIKGITPLVVDYARKFGIDIPSAAVQVGKALDGQVGALKRNGVSIDEVLFKTDRYAAVQQALSQQVGGFAEAEGKTFAGSVQRMKNELGDLAEGVGVGAVDAFSSMFGVIDGVTTRLNDLSPATQSAIGKFATFGSVGLIAAGGASILIGQIIKIRDNFLVARDAVSAFAGSGGLGRLARAGLVIGGLIALREVVMALDDDLDDIDVSTLENELLDLAETGKMSGEQLKSVFDGFGDLLEGGDPEKLEAWSDRLGEVDKALAQLAGRDPETAAAAFREITAALQEQGATRDQVTGFFNDYAAAVANADTASRTGAGGVDELGGAMGEQTEATENAKSALQEYNEALQAQFDPLFGAIDASHQLAEANAAVHEAEVKVAEAVREHGAGSVEATAADVAYREALMGATEAALGQQSALITLKDAVANGSVSVAAAKETLAQWVAQGVITQASADETSRQIDGVTTSMHNVPDATDTSINAHDRASPTIASVGNALFNLHGDEATVTIRQRVINEVLTTNTFGLFNPFVGHEGGIVPGPRGQEVAAILQAGERVISLSEMSAMAQPLPGAPGGGGSGYVDNRTINVYVDGADPQRTVEAIKRYERANGPGWRN